MKRFVTLALAASMLALAACAPTKSTATAPPRVVVWGDSFGVSVAPYLAPAGYDVRAYGGLAPCDSLPDIRATAANGPPTVAVLLFVGNKLADGGCDYPAAVQAITTSLASRGSRVVWIAVPFLPIFPEARATLNALYPNPAHGPANSIGGDVYLSVFRAADGNHLSAPGAQLFADAIKQVVG
jgi:hypothetical protein